MKLSFPLFGLSLLAAFVGASVIQLNQDNFDSVTNPKDLVLVNFYADWCHFSRQLAPVFDQAAVKVKEALGDLADKVDLAKVDADAESNLSRKFGVNKYPTIKIFRHGEVDKKEYRGARSVEAFVAFVKEQMVDPIDYVHSLQQGSNFNDEHRHLVGFFIGKNSNAFSNFAKLATTLKDDCKLHAYVVPENAELIEAGPDGASISFWPSLQETSAAQPIREPIEKGPIKFVGSMEHFEPLVAWAKEKCIPLIREITFENAEELTEQGIPFLIYFYHPDKNKDKNLADFHQAVKEQLVDQKDKIMAVYADGRKFAHPLMHLGKSESDLPVLAIDSFKHMYLWPYDAGKFIRSPNMLKQFVADLHSGKLHREFHYGPDSTPATPQIEGQQGLDPSTSQPPSPSTTPEPTSTSAPLNNIEALREKRKADTENEAALLAGDNATISTGDAPAKKADNNTFVNVDSGTKQPPESTFAKLKPSNLRYSLRDEL